MRVGRKDAHRAAVVVLMFALAREAPAEDGAHGAGYLDIQRWVHAADVMANESVTHEICGWGVIDLRTALLSAAIRQGVDGGAWDVLAKRYDDAERDRRRNEALLTAHGANAPALRTSGLYAAGGCTDDVRERIRRRAAGIGP